MTKSVNTYSYPLATELITHVVEDTSSNSHEGPYRGSIDFAVPLGTIVTAAADGIIRRVRDDSDRHGKVKEFGPDVNYVTIEHSNGELSEYLHLDKNSALANVGDVVKTGQAIARTGLSGWLFEPHLHFMVYNNGERFQCLEIQFRN